MEEPANTFITLARQCSNVGNYSRAFDLYLVVFTKCPQDKDRFEQEFRNVLSKFNELLEATGQIQDIFYNFKHALTTFPNNANFLNDIGKYLYKFGFYKEALCHFQKALSLDSGFVNAEKNLNSLKNFLMERWHFRMLNDKTRNSAYWSALQKTIGPCKDTVLDLGTGTGLLAMYAHDCRAISTTGCDSSETMVQLAEKCLKENDCATVDIVNFVSTNMDKDDIGGRRSVLVTELFDAGLFGEQILQALDHAKDSLLQNQHTIVPNKAEFFIAGVKCETLNLKYHISLKAKKLLNIENVNVQVLAHDETYDCEDVYQYKDLKYITEPQQLVKIDFNNMNDIQDKLNRTEPYEVNLKAVEKGEIDLFIGWFKLHLTDKITLTTDPRSESRANAWQQAVFYDNLPHTIENNDTIKVEFMFNKGKLAILPNYEEILKVSPEIIRFLNDTDYIDMITKCIGMACIYLGQIVDISQVDIVDLCPFPYFGLLMLKRGAQSVTCCAKTDNDKYFLKHVLKANKILRSKVTVLTGNEWSHRIFRHEKYHVIFCNILDMCGDIDLRMADIANELRRTHLHQNGLIMPAKITISGQLVNSHWLDINNRLYDENVLRYKMAVHVNKYQVSQNYGLDLARLEYTPMTRPVLVGKLIGGMQPEVINVPIIKDGECNAVVCWYNIKLMVGLGKISTNRSNSYVDSMAFLANPPIKMVKGKTANILRCIDYGHLFKLMLDVEAN